MSLCLLISYSVVPSFDLLYPFIFLLFRVETGRIVQSRRLSDDPSHFVIPIDFLSLSCTLGVGICLRTAASHANNDTSSITIPLYHHFHLSS